MGEVFKAAERASIFSLSENRCSFYEVNSLFMASHYPHDVQEPFSSADAEKALKLAQEVQQLLSEHFFHRTPPKISRSEDKRSVAHEDCGVVAGEAAVIFKLEMQEAWGLRESSKAFSRAKGLVKHAS